MAVIKAENGRLTIANRMKWKKQKLQDVIPSLSRVPWPRWATWSFRRSAFSVLRHTCVLNIGPLRVSATSKAAFWWKAPTTCFRSGSLSTKILPKSRSLTPTLQEKQLTLLGPPLLRWGLFSVPLAAFHPPEQKLKRPMFRALKLKPVVTTFLSSAAQSGTLACSDRVSWKLWD